MKKSSDATVLKLKKSILKPNNNLAPRKNPGLQTGRKIEGAKKGTDIWTIFTNISVAARKLNLQPQNIHGCCTGKYEFTGGYKFRYVKQNLYEGEIFKNLPPKYKTKIQISNMGRYKQSNGNIVTPNPKSDGYSCIGIGCKTYAFHRLVLISFNVKPEYVSQLRN